MASMYRSEPRCNLAERVTASPEFFKGKKAAEIRAFFEEAVHFIEKHQSKDIEGIDLAQQLQQHIPLSVEVSSLLEQPGRDLPPYWQI